MKNQQKVEFEQKASKCCGMDVHKKEIVATVEGEGITKETRSFPSTTRSLTVMKEWLLSLGITHVAILRQAIYPLLPPGKDTGRAAF
jgi:hypothetical protein